MVRGQGLYKIVGAPNYYDHLGYNAGGISEDHELQRVNFCITSPGLLIIVGLDAP